MGWAWNYGARLSNVRSRSSVYRLKNSETVTTAPQAYKPIGPVIQAQEEAGLIRGAVRLKPWITFKA
ncbi:RtcB family protein [Ralstonia pseudosolanacearum]